MPSTLADLLSYFADIGFTDLYLGKAAGQQPPVARVEASEQTPPSGSEGSLPVVEGSAAERREALQAVGGEAAGCTRCRLAEGRRNVVFGTGNPDAALMLIGEGPGEQEDLQGEPFVGPAGSLLNRILKAIDRERQEVYIANVVKCRPPRNRNPEPDEVAACRGYLERQIDLVAPKVIVLLGAVAARAMLDSNLSVGRLRGRWHSVRGVPARVTYHPAALLRNTSYKRPTWEDMQAVRDRLAAEA